MASTSRLPLHVAFPAGCLRRRPGRQRHDRNARRRLFQVCPRATPDTVLNCAGAPWLSLWRCARGWTMVSRVAGCSSSCIVSRMACTVLRLARRRVARRDRRHRIRSLRDTTAAARSAHAAATHAAAATAAWPAGFTTRSASGRVDSSLLSCHTPPRAGRAGAHSSARATPDDAPPAVNATVMAATTACLSSRVFLEKRDRVWSRDYRRPTRLSGPGESVKAHVREARSGNRSLVPRPLMMTGTTAAAKTAGAACRARASRGRGRHWTGRSSAAPRRAGAGRTRATPPSAGTDDRST
jgi:hypothetical protein